MPTEMLERKCGECAVCCTVAEIPGFKPAHYQCVFENKSPEGSCGCFETMSRPPICKRFQCMWLRGMGREEDRPDKIGAMFTINNTVPGKVIGFVGEQKLGAVQGTAKEMAVTFAEEVPMPLMVVLYGKDNAGEYVILHDRHRRKALAMIGTEVVRLSPRVAMYERVIP